MGFLASWDRNLLLENLRNRNLLLRNRNLLLGKHGFPPVLTYPARARPKFGDGHLGEVRFATDIAVGIAGCNATLTASALEAYIQRYCAGKR